MARNILQQLAYQQAFQGGANTLAGVVSMVGSINTGMGTLNALYTRLNTSLTTPDPQFGTADAADVAAIAAFLAQWTTVQSTPMSFQQAVAAFLANPPSI